MLASTERKIVLVTRHTRLEDLVVRYHTLAQARFYLDHLGADFGEYAAEHEAYSASKRVVLEAVAARGRYQVIDRGFLPNFLFAPDDVVVALGQDGLVANTMKYLDGQPLIGVNPDPFRYDGILLPFEARDLAPILGETISDSRQHKEVTMAVASLADGQQLFAVNDLFIGPQSHISARYRISLGEATEVQSSSGIIVSTGLGSTGWMKSVITGSVAVVQTIDGHTPVTYTPLPWNTDRLLFAVREPFPSKTSSASIVFGHVTQTQPLVLSSLMPENGVIFSDGIEVDRLAFNSGAVAMIQIASRRGRLIV